MGGKQLLALHTPRSTLYTPRLFIFVTASTTKYEVR